VESFKGNKRDLNFSLRNCEVTQLQKKLNDGGLISSITITSMMRVHIYNAYYREVEARLVLLGEFDEDTRQRASKV